MYQIKRRLLQMVLLGSLALLPFVSTEVSAVQTPKTTSITNDDNSVAYRGYRHGGFNRGYYGSSYYPRYYYYNNAYPSYNNYYPYGGGSYYYYNNYPNSYYSPGLYLRFGW